MADFGESEISNAVTDLDLVYCPHNGCVALPVVFIVSWRQTVRNIVALLRPSRSVVIRETHFEFSHHVYSSDGRPVRKGCDIVNIHVVDDVNALSVVG